LRGYAITAHFGARAGITFTWSTRLHSAIAFARGTTGRAVTVTTHLRLLRAFFLWTVAKLLSALRCEAFRLTTLRRYPVTFRSWASGSIAAHFWTVAYSAITRATLTRLFTVARSRTGGAFTRLLAAHIGTISLRCRAFTFGLRARSFFFGLF
ncbi:MAG: hypothetical protein K0Q55_635, partial [Verrucomicrobia bacterium]|jgi:hypothetical protein|nr:hypothetical protein [Verrucomicrobiota bacterium]